jgi:hypothetical protein
MNLNSVSIAGPFTHENLSIFLLLGDDALDGRRFIPLEEALVRKCVTVHETGQVGELTVENLSDSFDVYIQAGDVVKGGRQDRTIGVDLVVPAKSGRVPVPSFCVEHGRWHRRGGENSACFMSSSASLSSKKLRLAAKLRKNQQQVWDSVCELQGELSSSVGKSVSCWMSPTSYQLSVEDKDLQARKSTYRAALAGIPDELLGAVGFAFVINGEINTADCYGSRHLFRKLWHKLLDAAIIEAIAEDRKTSPLAGTPIPTPEDIRQWFAETEHALLYHHQEVPPRLCVDTRRIHKTVIFDTLDHAFDAVLHKNLVTD